MFVKYYLNRRRFLATSAAAIMPVMKFPSDPRHRLAVATYPFRDVIVSAHKTGAGKLTLDQFAATLREKFGVYGIEPWAPHFESVEPAYIAHLSAAFKKAGLKVVNIPCDIRVNLCGTPDQRTEALAKYHQWVDAAITLGSPSIRVHCPAGSNPADISCAVDGLKALAAYGESKNIVINLENDDPSSEDPARVLKVIETAGTPYLRSLPDFCNSMLIHNDQDYNARALATLFPHAYNISHVKDVEYTDDNKPVRVDVARIFAIAKEAHYHGYFSMESEGKGDPYQNTNLLIEASIRNLS